ncbi:MAG: spore coat protein CotJB [Oscillospiraceae bacterium]
MDETLIKPVKPAENDNCDFKNGPLPSCAPLAVSYVPIQQEAKPQYKSSEALTRGTLFPGLDLPFLNIPNKTNPYAGTPLGELMALSFMIGELNLYLNTHPNDQEAFEALKTCIMLYNEGQEKYSQMYGPISIGDLVNFKNYTWLHDPWPWEYTEGMEMD